MGLFDFKPFYKSGDTPKYQVGELVYRISSPNVLSSDFYMPMTSEQLELLETWYMKHLELCKVIAVSEKKSGLIWKEFTYTLESLVNWEIHTYEYESNLKPFKEE
jgi:hypothetical protein